VRPRTILNAKNSHATIIIVGFGWNERQWNCVFQSSFMLWNVKVLVLCWCLECLNVCLVNVVIYFDFLSLLQSWIWNNIIVAISHFVFAYTKFNDILSIIVFCIWILLGKSLNPLIQASSPF
jgi:hypothetical protein